MFAIIGVFVVAFVPASAMQTTTLYYALLQPMLPLLLGLLRVRSCVKRLSTRSVVVMSVCCLSASLILWVRSPYELK